MILIDCKQGTPEWENCRIGIPTASQVDRIITPASLKPSAQAATYRNQLLAEYLMGMALDWTGQSQWMERGVELEAEAVSWYEFDRSPWKVDRVGFVYRDDKWFGGSPDGLVGADGLVEIKCPALHTHVGYLVEPETLEKAYKGQVQSYLMLTGRAWADLVAYSPQLPPVIRRLEPDARYQAALTAALNAFITDLIRQRERLEQYRAQPVQAAA